MLAKATRLSGRRRYPSGGKYRPDRLPWRTISAGRADFGRMAGSQVGSCERAPKCRRGAWAGGSLLPFAPSQGRRCIDPLPVRPRSAPELSSQVAHWSSLRRTPPPSPQPQGCLWVWPRISPSAEAGPGHCLFGGCCPELCRQEAVQAAGAPLSPEPERGHTSPESSKSKEGSLLAALPDGLCAKGPR